MTSSLRSHNHNWQQQSNHASSFSKRPALEEIDGTNVEHVHFLLEDLQTKYEQILENLKSDLHQHKLQQEEVFASGIVKLPKSIRQMTVQEFNAAHKCDILNLLKSKDGVLPTTSSSSSSTNLLLQKKRDYHMAVAETPAPTRSRGPNRVPGSAMRTVVKGEGIFSRNGSPLETTEVGSVIATVTKKRRGNGDTNNTTNNNNTANFEINVGDGRFISLNDPSGVKELDSSMKATAATQLKVLQDQMASLMAQLTN